MAGRATEFACPERLDRRVGPSTASRVSLRHKLHPAIVEVTPPNGGAGGARGSRARNIDARSSARNDLDVEIADSSKRMDDELIGRSAIAQRGNPFGVTAGGGGVLSVTMGEKGGVKVTVSRKFVARCTAKRVSGVLKRDKRSIALTDVKSAKIGTYPSRTSGSGEENARTMPCARVLTMINNSDLHPMQPPRYATEIAPRRHTLLADDCASGLGPHAVTRAFFEVSKSLLMVDRTLGPSVSAKRRVKTAGAALDSALRKSSDDVPGNGSASACASSTLVTDDYTSRFEDRPQIANAAVTDGVLPTPHSA